MRCFTTHALSMGQGSGHGSAPVDDDDDDSLVEDMSPVKGKKPSKRASKAKKNYTKEKEPPKDWTTTEEIALRRTWCNVSENGEKGNAMKAKGFWDAVIKHEFTLEACWNLLKDHQGWLEGMSLRKRLKNIDQWVVTVQWPKRNHPPPLVRDLFQFVDLVADKFLKIKSTMEKDAGATRLLHTVKELGVGYPGGGTSLYIGKKSFVGRRRGKADVAGKNEDRWWSL
ncbi:hypothetical protein Tco_1292092 [Tanacetum coccineum]